MLGGKFLSVAASYTSIMHDTRILRNTSTFERAENRDILCSLLDISEGLKMQPPILPDSAFPFDWLIKLYMFSPNLTSAE